MKRDLHWDPDSLGERVSSARLCRDDPPTLEDVSASLKSAGLNVDANWLRDLEANRLEHVSTRTLAALARILGVPLNSLLDGGHGQTTVIPRRQCWRHGRCVP